MQSNNEYRTFFRATASHVAVEEVGGERLDQRIDQRRDTELARVDDREPDRIAGGIMLEALLIFTAILKRLAQSKVKVERVLVGKAAAKHLMHRRESLRRETKRLQIGKCPVSETKCRSHANGILQCFDRFDIPTDHVVSAAEVDPDAGAGVRTLGHRLVNINLALVQSKRCAKRSLHAHDWQLAPDDFGQ